ncbi:beta-galactosidase [Xanthomonas oryzae pv. oryzae]|uniref:glycoside hydrolase family 35 protein n=1 Tax=Xanthomonas oryzae TaxID=347 RepID=UPI0008599221|nr:beta-galactosidase family protein [Xanthomonas oryzae]AOS22862.1 beta-galactosidase [Xanthomonas oryzae pv. oryzae]RBD59441.1 beta-galactosidase [Xanthomonas oryzae pv. oryzae]RBE12313.1 beta-galactosidase [Xanthomonas oryzae pv. oryzae]RBH50478.1 beta-galactosidase [Xanthomonas oryzae pv. oryzae]UMA60262.1 beta-galactosidase [Xanthomonas oryzae pv. oryzae]
MLRTTLAPLVLALAFALPVTAAAADTERWPDFGTQGTQFVRDGKPYQLLSGAIHFQRIPRAYWKDRLQKARALGLNTVETYVFWNLVEPQQGQFDFSGNNDVAAFVQEAAAQGLNVILRPGPYACAEWEAGGYPAWLFGQGNIRVRSRDPRFLAASQAYLDAVAKQVQPLLNHNGGPIIAVQVENEYGSYADDHAYMADNRAMYVKAGFDKALLFTSDGADMLANGTLPDTLAVVNFAPGEAKSAFDKLIAFRPDQPRMVGEYWAGWFDHWGKPHAATDATQQAEEFEWILRQGHSANLYMFIGGTSFGFMNGANFQNNPSDHYAPQTTSYDYDAIVDEAGRPTAKFALMRDAIARVTGVQPPALPAPIATTTLPDTPLRESASLWDNLPAPITIDTPQPMEHFGQDYGYILYRTTVTGPRKGPLYLGDVRDVAHVYLDQTPVGSVERRLQQVSTAVDIPAGHHTLDVLVENSGRINYGPRMADGRAGLVDPVLLGNQQVTGWQAFPLPMRAPDSIRGWTRKAVQGPAFHRGTVRIGTPADTYLDMRAFGKGFAWANGVNLGRHWNIGPQTALYFPAPFQRKGDNTVVVFDLDDVATPSVRGLKQQVWRKPKE